MIVVLDGPAGSGKSTTARSLAEFLGFVHLDTGATYRVVTLAAQRAGVTPESEGGLKALLAGLVIRLEPGRVFLGDEDVSLAIRADEISRAVSYYAALPLVRDEMVRLQREWANGRDVVGEGRDLATVVFPRADLKVFLDADIRERARRRARELGLAAEAEIAAQARFLTERDRIDSEREHSPLSRAADSLDLDTTSLSPREVVQRLAAWTRAVKEGCADPRTAEGRAYLRSLSVE